MSNTVKFSVVLGLICLGGALGVGTTYVVTREAIRKREVERHEKALKEIFGDLKFDALNEEADLADRVFRVTNQEEKLVGYAATGVAQGYSSELKVLVGLGPERKVVKGVNVLSQEETPGLGARVEERKTDKTWWKVLTGQASARSDEDVPPWFPEGFKEIRVENLKLQKTGQAKPGIEAITGATITSRAVLAAVENAVGKIKKLVEEDTKD